MSRLRVIKWLLEKLLTSFAASIVIYIGPMLGLNFQKIGFGYVYTIITATTLSVSFIVYFLVPKENSQSNN